MNGPFDPNAPSPVKIDPAIIPSRQAEGVPADQIANLQNLKGSVTFAGVNGLPRTESPMRKNNFGPRIGVAYQINEKLVMRTGFGLYYSNPTNDFFRTSGFSTSTNINNSLDSGRTFIPGLFTNPFPNGINRPIGSSLGAATFVGQNPSWFDPGFVTPKVWSFSAGFQYQATKSSTLEVSYVGSRSYDLNMDAGYNIMPASFEKQCDLYKGGSPIYCQQQVPNPFKSNPLFISQSIYTSNTLNRDVRAQHFTSCHGADHQSR